MLIGPRYAGASLFDAHAGFFLVWNGFDLRRLEQIVTNDHYGLGFVLGVVVDSFVQCVRTHIRYGLIDLAHVKYGSLESCS